MPQPPETRLLPACKARANDLRLVLALSALPAGGQSARTRVGVLNEAGLLYREVILHSAMEALYLRARANALGMRYMHARRLGKFPAFDAIIA